MCATSWFAYGIGHTIPIQDQFCKEICSCEYSYYHSGYCTGCWGDSCLIDVPVPSLNRLSWDEVATSGLVVGLSLIAFPAVLIVLYSLTHLVLNLLTQRAAKKARANFISLSARPRIF